MSGDTGCKTALEALVSAVRSVQGLTKPPGLQHGTSPDKQLPDFQVTWALYSANYSMPQPDFGRCFFWRKNSTLVSRNYFSSQVIISRSDWEMGITLSIQAVNVSSDILRLTRRDLETMPATNDPIHQSHKNDRP